MFNQGKLHGYGVGIDTDHNGNVELFANRYEGYFKNGLHHGKGTLYYGNGTKFFEANIHF